MKKIFAILTLCTFLVVLSSCTEKRCKCTTVRRGYPDSFSYEPKGDHASCSELDAEWYASDSVSMLKMTCEDE